MYGMVTSHSSAGPGRPHRSPDQHHRSSGAASSSGRQRVTQPQPMYRRIINALKQAVTGVRFSVEVDIDEFDDSKNRHKPKGLDALCRTTKFNRQELQRMYRGFKQACPSGMVREDTLRDIYARFFPCGDATLYSHFLFNSFDHDRSGEVTFEEFAVGLSELLRGSIDDKLRWTFNLYDINRDGCITKEEMLAIVTSIYSLLGTSIEPQVDDDTAKNHVERVFQKLDKNQDGFVTMDEFTEFCLKDDAVNRALCMFDSA